MIFSLPRPPSTSQPLQLNFYLNSCLKLKLFFTIESILNNNRITISLLSLLQHNYFANFPTHYPMTITMIFGSFIGGATAEGGGAVAFPVMTLVLHLAPSVARDFSFMIQCCGKVFWLHFSFFIF